MYNRAMTRELRREWYSVRSLVRVVAIGTPRQTGTDFNAESTLVEERIVLFQADGLDDALNRAREEAKEYCKRTYRNIYGQRVRLKSIAVLDAFRLLADNPGERAEVYSSTELVDRSVSNAALIQSRRGSEGRKHSRDRYPFLDANILKPTLAAIKAASSQQAAPDPFRPSAAEGETATDSRRRRGTRRRPQCTDP